MLRVKMAGKLALTLAAVNPYETRSGMVAGDFPVGGFLLRLRFGFALLDALDDLLLAEACILKTCDRRAAHCRTPFQSPMQDKFEGRI